eukprot:2484581-Rhodomonas_salina.1
MKSTVKQSRQMVRQTPARACIQFRSASQDDGYHFKSIFVLPSFISSSARPSTEQVHDRQDKSGRVDDTWSRSGRNIESVQHRAACEAWRYVHPRGIKGIIQVGEITPESESEGSRPTSNGDHGRVWCNRREVVPFV